MSKKVKAFETVACPLCGHVYRKRAAVPTACPMPHRH